MGTYDSSSSIDYPKIIPRSRKDLTISRLVRMVLYTLSVIIAGWHLYFAYTYAVTELKHSNIHLGLLLAFYFIAQLDHNPSEWRDHVKNGIHIVLLLGITSTTVFVHFNYDRWLNRARALAIYTDIDLAVGGILIVTVLIATYLAFGRGMVGTILLIIGYAMIGPSLPGFLEHSGISFERMIFLNTISLTGIYGSLLAVAATVIFVFILYAGMAQGYKELDSVIELSKNVSKYVPSGIPQVAVVSSTIVGSFMGSTTANTATTGSFTIPLMIDEEIDPRTAGAIEAIASNVGQLLPPVMGTVAFLMADILPISYFDVIQAAILPALMFFMSVSGMVYILHRKNGWGNKGTVGETTSAEPESNVSAEISPLRVFPLFGSLLILVYILVVLRYDPLLAAVYTTFAIIGLALVRDIIFVGPQIGTIWSWARQTIEGFRQGAETMAPLTAVLAGLGIAVQIFSATGLSQKLALELLTIAGGSLIIILLLAMGTTILFTMAMPTPAAYIFVAIMTAPVLVEQGIEGLTAHMFVFYFANFSSIVPPVGLALVVAAGIAGVSFWQIARECFRIGLFVFVLPFTIVFNENLLFWNTMTPLTYLSTFIGVVILLFGTIGHNTRTNLSVGRRLVYSIFGIAIMVIPNLGAKLTLATLGVIWIIYLFSSSERIGDMIPTR